MSRNQRAVQSSYESERRRARRREFELGIYACTCGVEIITIITVSGYRVGNICDIDIYRVLFFCNTDNNPINGARVSGGHRPSRNFDSTFDLDIPSNVYSDTLEVYINLC